jgi:hypothetical protein
LAVSAPLPGIAPGSTSESSLATGSPPTLAAVTTGSNAGRDEAEKAQGDVHQLVVKTEDLGARLAHLTRAQREKWLHASAAMPAFCHDWNRMLHDREVNNLSHLDWHERQGYETASYTGYGQVEGCQCKESDEGVPIGKVTYQEMNYYLAGRSIQEAKAHPKLLGTTNTLEIFSWEKDRWFY